MSDSTYRPDDDSDPQSPLDRDPISGSGSATDHDSVPGGDDIPVPEPDASLRAVTAEPRVGEFGVDTFVREIASYVSRLMDEPVADLVVRENPWDRRPCPTATFYDMTVAGHRIRITSYEASRGAMITYAITLDDQRIEFTREPVDLMSWQLARAIWFAHLDRPRHGHPVNPNDTKETK